MEFEHSIPAHKFIDRRQLIYLAILALAVFLLLPRLIGFDHVIRLLSTAEPIYIVIALATETVRYFSSAGSTIALARLFDRRVPLIPMTGAFFAGAALNRTFSTGGAPGMFVRLVFLMRQGVHAGSVAAIFLIEDLIGLVIGAALFAVGITTLTGTPAARVIVELAISFLVGSALLVLLMLVVFRQRAGVERIIHRVARAGNRIAERFFRRTISLPDRVQHVLDDFYTGLHAARQAPRCVVAAWVFNVIRYIAGGATLYFAFFALGDTISPSVLILLYTAASVLSTTSALAGEIAIMGTGYIVLFGTLGLTPEAAILALILSRSISFWLPIPVGYLALFHLRRRHNI